MSKPCSVRGTLKSGPSTMKRVIDAAGARQERLNLATLLHPTREGRVVAFP